MAMRLVIFLFQIGLILSCTQSEPAVNVERYFHRGGVNKKFWKKLDTTTAQFKRDNAIIKYTFEDSTRNKEIEFVTDSLIMLNGIRAIRLDITANFSRYFLLNQSQTDANQLIFLSKNKRVILIQDMGTIELFNSNIHNKEIESILSDDDNFMYPTMPIEKKSH